MKRQNACIICAGCLALAASASADIVWSGEKNLTVDTISGQKIDLNSDSLVDVALDYSVMGDTGGQVGFLEAYVGGFGVDGPSRVLVSTSSPYDGLPYGTLISSTPDPAYEWGGGIFFAGRVSEWSTYTSPPTEEWFGLLGEVGNAYVGIEFEVEGSTHYGWVNLALGEEGYLGFEDPIVTSWAYESTSNTGIVAGAIPEPSTSILTVGGSLALLLLARSRRREKQGCDTMPRCRAPKAPATPEEW